MTVTLQTENFDAFFDAPFAAYGTDSPYVSPLRSDLKRFLDKSANPLFRGNSDLTYFTAHRDGRVVGRITAHFHAESNAMHDPDLGYFGYFDCADDADAAAALLTAAADWLRARDFSKMAGNFNLTAMQQIGVVTEGFDRRPYLDQVWSPPHIARLLTENGFAPQFPMATFSLDLTRGGPTIGPKQQAILDDPAFAFAPVTRHTIPARMDDARLILNASFADNPMFVPVTADEFHFQAKDMKWIMDPRLSVVLHHHGKPAACVICVPDLNPLLRRIGSRMGISTPWHYLRHRMTNTGISLIFLGVIPALQNRGVNPLLMARIMQAARDAGYKTLANTWIADENGASLAQAVKAGADQQHRLHLFAKAI
ncbi:hypothetical protein [Yoonia sp. 208BN28-4]|uniref:hypothetical protein n=1 Tax=Yoonia sp. 208BN28-4 TaxID=3126505 RepID=UPI0030A01E23